MHSLMPIMYTRTVGLDLVKLAFFLYGDTGDFFKNNCMGTLSKMNRPEGIENKTKFKICHGCIQVPYCTSERYGVELDSTLIYVP